MRRPFVLALGFLCALAPAVTSAAPPSPSSSTAPAPDGARIIVAPDGHVGAWLVSGPFRVAPAKPTKTDPPLIDVVPPGVDERALKPMAGATVGPEGGPTWVLGTADGGTVDLKASLALTNKDKDVLAYAGATLVVPKRGKYTLLLGVDDGVRVFVDGQAVFTRDDPRPVRDDDDAVVMDLAAGAHTILLKVRQRDGAFAFRPRLLDGEWRGDRLALVLPGVTNDDAEKLVQRTSFITVDRGPTEQGYEPKIIARAPAGMLKPIVATARLVIGGSVVVGPSRATLGTVGPTAGSAEISLPAIEGDALARIEDKTATMEVDVGGRAFKVPFAVRRATRLALRRALFALADIPTARPTWLRPSSFETVDHWRRRLLSLVSRGDGDLDAQNREAKELDDAAARLEAHRDPLEGRVGAIRRAHRSPQDGEPSPYGLYVPESYRPGANRTYPLIVALHGLNGKPMAMLRWFFGGDDPKMDQDWEDRHADDPPLTPLEAFVVTPNGHGNSMYRQLGEDDVMQAVDDVMALYPIDATKVTITGPSMGGIGAASLALRHPDRFAASAPLCGYHSVFVRGDVLGRAIRPWERFLGEERSNVSYAWNGRDLPMFIVHGTQDLPVENSNVLIDRYEALKYSVVHEHPVLGHNVWQPTYENQKGAKWLLGHSRNLHPPSIRFRTARPRDGRIAWATIEELSAPDAWGELEARVKGRTTIEATTHGIAVLRFDRDEKLVDPSAPLQVTIDGTTLTFAPGEVAAMHREEGAWKAGLPTESGPRKRAHLAGPMRDVFHEPILFVYGASDPAEARANEETARALARIRYGVDVRYPLMSDTEFLARGEPIAQDRVLFLVGAAHSNAVLKQLDAELPIHVGKDNVVVGAKRIEGGKELGAAFVVPNPRRPDRYLAVVAGTGPLGTLRSQSLPDLLPDFIVYDERLAPARGQQILGSASVLAAGFFGTDWSLPKTFDDPYARRGTRPAPRPEPTSSTGESE